MNSEYYVETKLFKISEKGAQKDLFSTKNFYFGVTADSGGKLSIKVEFSEKEAADPKKKKEADFLKKVKRPISLDLNPANIAQLQNDMRKIINIPHLIGLIKLDRKKKLLALSKGKDLVQLNKDTSQFQPLVVAERRQELLKMNEEHMEMVQTRKHFHYVEDKQRKTLNFLKSEFYKVIKEYAIEKQKETYIKNQIIMKWVNILCVVNATKIVAARINRIREIERARVKMAAHMAIIRAVANRKLRRKGKDARERMIFEMRLYTKVIPIIIQVIADSLSLH